MLDRIAERDARRWVRRALAGLLAVVAFVALAVLVLLHSLDRPWLKRRLQGLALTSAGLELDYRALRVDLFSGAELDGLVLRSPTELRPFAADLVRVGRVAARWSPRSLLFGDGPVLSRVALSDIELNVVVDEHGRTSFDALSPSAARSEQRAAVPLSRRASELFATAPPIGALEVDRVTLALIRTARRKVLDRTELGGVSLMLATSSPKPPARGWRARAGLGSRASPLSLELSRTGSDGERSAARARFWLAIDATSSGLSTVLDLRMIEQTLVASVSADHWLHAEAKLRFDPRAGRTELTLDHAEAGDGAVAADASLELSDAGDAIVRRARGDIDLARLLRWCPPGLVPASAERARLRFLADSLAAGPTPRSWSGGALDIEAELSNVALSASSSPLRVGEATLSLHAQPAQSGAIAGRGSVRLAGTRLAWSADSLAADNVGADFDGRRGADGVIDGHAELRFGRIERGGALSLVARDGRVALRVRGLRPAPDAPIATRGDVTVSLDLKSLDARFDTARARFDALALRAHTTLEGHEPYAAELEARASGLSVTTHDGDLVANAPASFETKIRDVEPDIVHPVATRAKVYAAIRLGELRAAIDAAKKADSIDFVLSANATSLKAARPLLPAALIDDVPWERIAVALRSSGSVEHLRSSSPVLAEKTELEIQRPAFKNIAARSLALRLESQGTAIQHEASVDLRARALAVAGGSPSDDHVALSASVDRTRPALQLELSTDGRATTKLSGSLSFDASRHALAYAIEGKLAGLAALAPLAASVHVLDTFDLSRLEIGLTSSGTLLGVIAAVSSDGSIALEPSPARSAAIEGTADLRVTHLRWGRGDAAIVAPGLAWHGDMHTSNGRRTLESRLQIGTLHLDLGSDDVELNGIDDQLSAAFIGNLIDPEIELTQRLAVRAVEQALVPEYPLGDVAFELTAERSPDGVVHISKMNVSNGSAGTALAVTGNVDLAEGRRTLSVTAALKQDLARLSTIPERFKGRGKIAIEANVTSPDFAHYHIRAAVKGQNVSLTLARAGVEVETANGEVPITVAVEVGRNGLLFAHSKRWNPYSMLRFADQHPLLSRSGFLSIARLKTPFASIAPLVGNLEIEQNVVSLRQFEMGVRGGSITGQCGIDWNGPRSTLELHVRANGVQSSHGEPFDGNIAVAISAADRTIDGRAEILRIGERHLLDLLDLQDPLHADAAMNRIRTALGFGYPKSVRLVFDHGFASAHLELGGLAKLVSISELRGIPMGPIVDRMLAPMLEAPYMKEMP
jgi:hypothetical protein